MAFYARILASKRLRFPHCLQQIFKFTAPPLSASALTGQAGLRLRFPLKYIFHGKMLALILNELTNRRIIYNRFHKMHNLKCTTWPDLENAGCHLNCLRAMWIAALEGFNNLSWQVRLEQVAWADWKLRLCLLTAESWQMRNSWHFLPQMHASIKLQLFLTKISKAFFSLKCIIGTAKSALL